VLQTLNETPEDLTARQQAVLDAVLRLMVKQGGSLTMADVARKASCSKETLYKWFGDRDGLLTATVRWQASKVRAGSDEDGPLDMRGLRRSLEDFAVNWLKVISSKTSIALNRVATGQAGSGKGGLGAIVLANGRIAIGDRLKPVLEAGKTAGLLHFDDSETAFRTFFGLVGRDVQIRLLLGDDLRLTEAAIVDEARRATDQFFILHGNAGSPSSSISNVKNGKET
jgi:AcrR family transcriptional regulator